MAVWKLTEEDRQRLISLAAKVDDENQSVLNEILAKKQMNLDDIQKIKVILKCYTSYFFRTVCLRIYLFFLFLIDLLLV